MKPKYLIRSEDIPAYQPANHHHTSNRRLIGPETVGARQMEVLMGTLHKGGGALPHAHPGIEQACHLLEGTAHVEVAGEGFEMLPGDTCFFPADAMHRFEVTSDAPVKLLVIYSPPYGESPDKVRRPARD
ncbi:cupin domain-containing protein [Variovorax ureilyticus]|uniref:Cupin domain-containing protein n=1 Tax=Variovorax ureilyticus TaxID=1836198 RepID=A0ABU8VPC3_9BURK